MNIKQAIAQSSLSIQETEILLAFLLKKTREFVIINQLKILNPSTVNRLRNLEKKRLQNWPIAYLIGEKEFYGINFKVNKNVLIPRPETEIIIDTVIEEIKNKNNKIEIIDIGTGSGAIIISIAKTLNYKFPIIYKKATFCASDISSLALKIATENSKYHKLSKKINFIKSDLLKSFRTDQLVAKDLIITANLPYLTPLQTKSEPSISREPRLALEAGKDGLKYYQRLVAGLKKIQFSSLFLICEIDPQQVIGFKNIIKKYWPKVKPLAIKDLRNKNRFMVVKIKNSD